MSRLPIALLLVVSVLGITADGTFAQQEPPPTIDLAQLLPDVLAKKVTVEFDETPLKDVAAWIQAEQQIPVVLDEPALTDQGIASGEPITDHLDDAPLYLLLERLSILGLAWPGRWTTTCCTSPPSKRPSSKSIRGRTR